MSIFNTTITKPTPTAPKGIWYGGPGIGKTTAAAKSGGLIIDCENGAGSVVCQRTPYLDNWPDIEQWLTAIEKENHPHKIVIVDTIDWLIRRLEEHVTGASKGQMATSLIKSHGGYGAGKDVLRNYIYRCLLPVFDRIVNKGIALILLAHANRTELTDVDGITIEKTVPDIHPLCLNAVLEWSDFICLINKDVEGKRTLLTTESNKAVAKNRYNMPPVIDFSWDTFKAAIATGLTANMNAK